MKKAISQQLLQEMVDYIVSQPYREVAMLVEKIKTETFEEVEITNPTNPNPEPINSDQD